MVGWCLFKYIQIQKKKYIKRKENEKKTEIIFKRLQLMKLSLPDTRQAEERESPF